MPRSFPGKLSVYSPDVFILVKFLSNGDVAVGMFNMGDVPAMAVVDFWDLGLTVSSGMALEFYDCIDHENLERKERDFQLKFRHMDQKSTDVKWCRENDGSYLHEMRGRAHV